LAPKFFVRPYTITKTIFMKRNSRRSLFAVTLIGTILFAIACSKSSSSGGNSSAITKENIAGTYKLTAATASIPGLPPQNVIDSIPACQRDDQYKLNVDFTFNYIDAGTKCTPPGDYNSTWSLIGTTKIVIGTDTANIQSFDGKALVVNSVVTISGIPLTTTDTFTKQ
jgi:hypothetical protein